MEGGVTTPRLEGGATVGGGSYNNYVLDGGGVNTFASGQYSTVGGGRENQTAGDYSTVGGGRENHAAGDYSVVPGGRGNIVSAGAAGSFAAGAQATAAHPGCFVWGDQAGGAGATTSLNANEFVVGSSGGATFWTDAGRTLGTTLAPGASAWSVVCDGAKKENLAPLAYADVLAQVEGLEIYEFNYIGTDPDVKCRGPLAQDWHSRFPSRKDPCKIDTLDLDGITLAALKGLLAKVAALELRVIELEHHNHGGGS